MTLFVATGNSGKIKEIRERVDDQRLSLEQIDIDVEEIQNLDVEKVAERKVKDSYRKAVEQGIIEEGEPLIVEDTGFFVQALDGFPGSMAKHFAATAGADKLIPMMKDTNERSAYFRSVIAYYDGSSLETFEGKMEGDVPEDTRGVSHPELPYNSFLVPEGESRSLAEDSSLKDDRFHRNKAIDKLLEWLKD